jgi:hypothetical protein
MLIILTKTLTHATVMCRASAQAAFSIRAWDALLLVASCTP